MLDPGHGGIDTGAIGHNGSKEKHVVLAIAKTVRSILRSNGIDARLTRTGDTFIPLYDRVEIAHQHGADLFMSIHADGFTNPSAAGASVFALSNRGASSAMAKYLSDRENRADEVAGKKTTAKRPSVTAGAVRSGPDGYHQKQPDAGLAYPEKILSRCISFTAATPNRRPSSC
ncbi:N-acetylmuramoyl-L-alanine amidase AmiA precursor [Raoultella terrigena]|uniref:N-acetylmuramoyl-L-alanine amidase n=1 Tax=Raoultella terrigena TaxID=577 RepID=A0A4U9D0T9_RAOTE|nr:N-acetylmuramoyl-L-alanine amidase AmiA precursor [Raoultella terrigena]